MKRYILISILILSMITLCSCTKKQEALTREGIQNVCKMSTLECYFNNVVKYEKKKDNIFQKDREMWIEYEGVAVLSFDMSKVSMKVVEDTVEIAFPQEVQIKVRINEEKLDDMHYVVSEDGLFFKNKITTEEQQSAMNECQDEMKKAVENNEVLLEQARNQAKEGISNYVITMGKTIGKEYKVVYKDAR